MTNLPFGFDRPEDSPGFLLWQTTILWQRQIKRILEPHNISHAQFVIMATMLWFSAHGHETTQTLIVQQTKLDKMTVSKSLKKLIALGYVQRFSHERDARAKSALLTDQGKDLINILVPRVEAVDRRYFDSINTDDQKSLIRLFAQVTKVNDCSASNSKE